MCVMKTSFYKCLCVVLVTIYSIHMNAYQHFTNDISSTLRVGLAGGGLYNMTPIDCMMKSKIGGGASFTYDCTFYKSFGVIDLGLRTGVDLGYCCSQYNVHFNQQFSNVDYLGNQIDYTTSGVIDIHQHQLYASVPLMLAFRCNGFIWNLGVRIQANICPIANQQLSSPIIEAYYPTYGVTITNALITGVVDNNQLYMTTKSSQPNFGSYAGTEIGYEYRINHKNCIGIVAYFDVGFWNYLPKKTDDLIISVSPIMDSNNPAAVVTINDAYRSSLTSYIPLQFGLKCYFAFDLQKSSLNAGY